MVFKNLFYNVDHGPAADGRLCSQIKFEAKKIVNKSSNQITGATERSFVDVATDYFLDWNRNWMLNVNEDK